MRTNVKKKGVKQTIKEVLCRCKVGERYFYNRAERKASRELVSQKEVRHKFSKIHEKETIYIIRRPRKCGFFSNFLYVLGHCINARQNNWIPVVDMQHYKTFYNEDKPHKNTKNAWEYYFEQPSAVSLKEAYKSRHIILSDGRYPHDKVPHYMGVEKCFPTRDVVKKMSHYMKQNIHIHDDIIQNTKQIFQKYKDKVTLGVHIRGTDMRHTKNHPIPAEAYQFIEKMKEVITKEGIEIIILCTDEAHTVDLVKECFGEMVIETNAYRALEVEEQGIHNSKVRAVREQHRFKLGLEVLEDALLLSYCQYLMCGHSSVPYSAILFNDNSYRDIFLVE